MSKLEDAEFAANIAVDAAIIQHRLPRRVFSLIPAAVFADARGLFENVRGAILRSLRFEQRFLFKTSSRPRGQDCVRVLQLPVNQGRKSKICRVTRGAILERSR